MAFDSMSTLKKNRVFAPVITGLAILLAVIFVRPMYASYSTAESELVAAKTALEQVKTQHDKLKAQEGKLADENSELAKTVKRIAKDFDSSEILKEVMINSHTTPNTASLNTKPSISISNITIDKGAKEPNGLYRGTVNMTISSDTSMQIAKFLDYLTKNSNFYFSLNSITLPEDTHAVAGANTVSVPVTLGLYYYP